MSLEEFPIGCTREDERSEQPRIQSVYTNDDVYESNTNQADAEACERSKKVHLKVLRRMQTAK